jgi:hypothetical protein
MNRQHMANDGLGLQVALGVFGFFLAGGLSLASGNSMMTNLIRGGIGMIVLFLLGYGLKFAWNTIVQSAEQGQDFALKGQADDDVRGSQVDIVLPEHAPGESRSVPIQAGSEEFVPLAQSVPKEQSLRDEEVRKLANALRHLND